MPIVDTSTIDPSLCDIQYVSYSLVTYPPYPRSTIPFTIYINKSSPVDEKFLENDEKGLKEREADILCSCVV